MEANSTWPGTNLAPVWHVLVHFYEGNSQKQFLRELSKVETTFHQIQENEVRFDKSIWLQVMHTPSSNSQEGKNKIWFFSPFPHWLRGSDSLA